MKTLNLDKLPTTKATYNMLAEYIYNNRLTLSVGMKLFYSTVRDMVQRELSKKACLRTTVSELLYRAYNIEDLILATGAAEYREEYVTL